MADAKSDYSENLVLQYLLTTNTVTRPSALYLALFTSDPLESGATGEATGGSYARQSVTMEVDGNTATNDGEVQFTGLPAATFTHFALFDAATAGNMLYHGELEDPKTVNANDTLTLPTGELDISEN